MRPSSPRPGARAASLVPLVLVACAAPPAEPLDDAHLADAVASRAVGPAELEAALAAAEAKPLAVPRPRFDAAALDDPDRLDFWRASAYAYAAPIRAARRDLTAAVARQDGAGLPGPVSLDADGVGFGGADREVEVAAAFDLLGLLGLGRSAAARALADADARAALGRLEAAVFAAGFAVARAQVELAAARAVAGRLAALVADDATDAVRRERLAAAGRLADGDAAMDAAARAELRRRVADADARVAAAVATLARAAGLPPAHPALARVAPSALDAALRHVDAAATPPDEAAAALLARRPDLRSAKLAYAVAEARLRAAAAEGTPEIALGPKLVFVPDLVLAGGVAALEAPWPGVGASAVAAALEERAAAREAVEDALLAALAEGAAARATLAARREAALRASVAEAATERAWRAAAARFRLDDDAGAFGERTLALERRAAAVVERAEAAAAYVVAALDLAEARGAEEIP